MRESATGKTLRWAGLAVGFVAMAIQLFISIPASLAAGSGIIDAIVWFFSFFTILTNVLGLLIYLAILRGARSGFFARASVKGCAAASFALVFLVYHFVLAATWAPTGLTRFCDVMFHYVSPVIYLAWWAFAGSDGATRWSDPLRWLAYPAAYTAYAVIRGHFTGVVPYPFFDSAAGYPALALNIAVIAAVFLVLGLLTVLADHLINRTRRPA